MYTPLPEGKLVIVRPPEMWVQWGLVPAGTCWTLEKAVYGLRESPALWSKTRDTELADMTWMVGKRTFRLQRCSSDSQVWILREDHPDRPELLGLLVVYVDDFLLQTKHGEMRDKFLKTLADIWTLSKNETLTVDHPLTFLGIEIELRANGDAFIHQQTFTESILAKHNMSKGSGNTCVQVDKLPETPDLPSAAQLKELQGFSGEFNWLATRTRPDMSYYVSVLASACTQHCAWSQDLAKKILRYLQSSRKQGLLLTAKGDLNELNGWTDAGFAGQETKSQSGLVVTWGGTIIVWRSSKQTVSAFSTAEAELNAAALGWQIIEGLRSLIADLGIILSSVNLLVDNQAAITIADCGGNWRTRYFAVRGHRIHEECVIGRAKLLHCPTIIMLADALTKLASPNVIQVLQEAMHGKLPTKAVPNPTSNDPDKGNPAHNLGDGPSPTIGSSSASRVHKHSTLYSHKGSQGHGSFARMCTQGLRWLILALSLASPCIASRSSSSSAQAMSEDRFIVEAAQAGVGDGAGIGLWNWCSLPENQQTGTQDFTADRLQPNVGTAVLKNLTNDVEEYLRVRNLTGHLTYEGLAAIHIPGYSTTKADKEPFAVYEFTPLEINDANKFEKTVQSYGKE